MSYKNKHFISIIIATSSVIKLDTGVNYVVDFFIRIILEGVKIMHALLINESELPIIMEGWIRRTLGSSRLSVIPNFIVNTAY